MSSHDPSCHGPPSVRPINCHPIISSPFAHITHHSSPTIHHLSSTIPYTIPSSTIPSCRPAIIQLPFFPPSITNHSIIHPSSSVIPYTVVSHHPIIHHPPPINPSSQHPTTIIQYHPTTHQSIIPLSDQPSSITNASSITPYVIPSPPNPVILYPSLINPSSHHPTTHNPPTLPSFSIPRTRLVRNISLIWVIFGTVPSHHPSSPYTVPSHHPSPQNPITHHPINHSPITRRPSSIIHIMPLFCQTMPHGYVTYNTTAVQVSGMIL